MVDPNLNIYYPSFVIWIILIPFHILEYNLGVNLFTSSIFTVLTILFLSWLFSLREKAEWKAVREEVYFQIKLELLTLFQMVADYFDEGFKLKNELLLEKDKVKNIGSLSLGLRNLRLTSVRKDNVYITNFFQFSDDIQNFRKVNSKLSEIQSLYSKHLPADITVSLIKIQNSISLIENCKLFNEQITNSSLTSHELLSSLKDSYDKIRVDMLNGSLNSMLEEIHKLHSSKELEFSFPS